MITLKDIKKAHERILPFIHQTKLIHSATFSRMLGANVYFKPENLQKTGSFKIRGALNKILLLKPAEREKGVITVSSGNHAQGVAYAAQLTNTRATIVMPEKTTQVKIDATRSYGASVLLYGESLDDAIDHAKKLTKEKGLTLVHPFDDEQIIAGQGTVGLEILEEFPETQKIVASIGGGGLISGISIAAKTINPKIKIYGVQTEGSDAMYKSLKAGQIIKLQEITSIAEGLGAKKPSELTFSLVKKYVDNVVTVTDEATIVSLMFILERMKLLTEPAASCTLAALIKKEIPYENGENIVVVLSGGNFNVKKLAKCILYH